MYRDSAAKTKAVYRITQLDDREIAALRGSTRDAATCGLPPQLYFAHPELPAFSIYATIDDRTRLKWIWDEEYRLQCFQSLERNGQTVMFCGQWGRLRFFAGELIHSFFSRGDSVPEEAIYRRFLDASEASAHFLEWHVSRDDR
jgi:hypothetical protein